MDDLLSIDEAANFLKVSKATIHNWRKQGIISCLRKGGRVYFSRRILMNSLKGKGKVK